MWDHSFRDFEAPWGADRPAPASAFGGCYARMALLAQRHEIVLIMRAASSQRDDMMHFLRSRNPALAFADLAERMRSNEPAPNCWPCAVVPFLHFRCSTVAIVPGRDQLFVGRTKLLVSESRAAGVAARMLWFPRHRIPPNSEATVTPNHDGLAYSS